MNKIMVNEVYSELFDEVILKNKKPTVVEVYTQNCPHCKILHPIFEQTSKSNKEKYNFYKLDGQKNVDIAKKFKVLSVPTLLFFSYGKLVDKKSGVISQRKIEKRLETILQYTEQDVLKKEVKGYFKLPWK